MTNIRRGRQVIFGDKINLVLDRAPRGSSTAEKVTDFRSYHHSRATFLY